MIQELESISKIWQVIYVIFVNFIVIHTYNTLKAMIWFMKVFHNIIYFYFKHWQLVVYANKFNLIWVILNKKDRRISPAGIVIIKSQEARTQENHREKALIGLKELIKEVMQVRESRRATAPKCGSQERRLERKNTRSKTKKFRRRPGMDD